MWQPEISPEGHITGHPEETIWSFEVWHTKENLLKDYPNCTPLHYEEGGNRGTYLQGLGLILPLGQLAEALSLKNTAIV